MGYYLRVVNFWVEEYKYWTKLSLSKEIKQEIYKEGLPYPSIVPVDKIKNIKKTIYN